MTGRSRFDDAAWYTELASRMRFEITYLDGRKREVDGQRFERSSAFAPVLQLAVGESAPNRYRTAGYKRIRRIA